MYLKELKLINFRNYEEQSVVFNRRFNYLIGNNAQGKTNIIEAIYLLSSGRSFRTLTDSELLRWGTDTLYIKGSVITKNGEKLIEISLRGNNKRIRINGVQLSKRGELFGNITTVVFSPDELKLVKEGPVFRRKFMDQGIINIKPAYYYTLTDYNRVLAQRNSLLKNRAADRINPDVLATWDNRLSEYGARLIYDRRDFVRRLSCFAKEIHSSITNNEEELSITYRSCIGSDAVEKISDIRSTFEEKLQSCQGRDLRTNVTNFGPHRENLGVYINGVNVRKYGSQGQQRTAALSIKLSEVELIKSETGAFPVLLLDDVMSELDLFRQGYILNNLTPVQTFVTCTHITPAMQKMYGENNVFSVKNGIIAMER